MSSHPYSAHVLPGARPGERMPAPRAGGALRIAAACVLALALVWVVAELMPAGQVRDALLLRHVTLLSGPHVDEAARILLHLLSAPLMVIWGLALVAFAIARGRPREGLAVAFVLVLAPLGADTLKPLLAHPHLAAGGVRIGAASWPSGHSAAALALALCAVLVSSPRARPLVAALGLLFSAAVGFALLVQAWHMPSDVIGGYLFAGLCMALAVAGLRAAERRWPQHAGSQRAP